MESKIGNRELGSGGFAISDAKIERRHIFELRSAAKVLELFKKSGGVSASLEVHFPSSRTEPHD